jgi:hypothetical protein
LQILLNHALAEILRDDEDTDNNPSGYWRARRVPGMQMTLGLLVPQHEYGNIPLPTVKTFKFPGLAALLLHYFRRTIPDSNRYAALIALLWSKRPRISSGELAVVANDPEET